MADNLGSSLRCLWWRYFDDNKPLFTINLSLDCSPGEEIIFFIFNSRLAVC